jgi:hypothetical protein
MELKTSAMDSTASAIRAWEWPKMPASILTAANTAFTANPRNVVRRLRLSRAVDTSHLCQKRRRSERGEWLFAVNFHKNRLPEVSKCGSLTVKG